MYAQWKGERGLSNSPKQTEKISKLCFKKSDVTPNHHHLKEHYLIVTFISRTAGVENVAGNVVAPREGTFSYLCLCRQQKTLLRNLQRLKKKKLPPLGVGG